jgi:hypothetical protein
MFTVQELDANMRPIIELLISTAVTSAVIKEMHASFLSKNVNFYLEKMPILEENLSRQSMSIEDLFGDSRPNQGHHKFDIYMGDYWVY